MIGYRDLVSLLWRSFEALKTIYRGLEVAEIVVLLTLSRLESINSGSAPGLTIWPRGFQTIGPARGKRVWKVYYILRTRSRLC